MPAYRNFRTNREMKIPILGEGYDVADLSDPEDDGLWMSSRVLTRAHAHNVMHLFMFTHRSTNS